MPFLTSSDALRKAMIKSVKSALRIDIAVAWVTPSPVLDELCQLVREDKKKLRSLVGLDFNQTHPDALDKLREVGEVRIGRSQNGVFHPKLYLFHVQQISLMPKARAIVGSANLTKGAFYENMEIAFEKLLDDNEYMQVKEFFEEQWEASKIFDDDSAKAYREIWKPRVPID